MGKKWDKRKKCKKWKMPKWMEEFRECLNVPEESMNCDGSDCSIFVNAPRALMCAIDQGKIGLLQSLYIDGRLKTKEKI